MVKATELECIRGSRTFRCTIFVYDYARIHYPKSMEASSLQKSAQPFLCYPGFYVLLLVLLQLDVLSQVHSRNVPCRMKLSSAN